MKELVRNCAALQRTIAEFIEASMSPAYVEVPEGVSDRVLVDVVNARATVAASLVELRSAWYGAQEEAHELAIDATSPTTRRWGARIAHALDPQSQLVIFKELGIPDRQLLRALPGLTGRTLRRWRSPTDPTSPPVERREQLDDVRAIVAVFVSDGSYDEKAIVWWLTTRQASLGQERPLDALGARRFHDVLGAAEHVIDLTTTPGTIPDQRETGGFDALELDGADRGGR